MKIFDSDDQLIIKKINQGSGYSRNLINIIDSLNNLHGTRIQIDMISRKANFLFETQCPEPTEEECQFGIEKSKELIELLIKHLILLRYLEKEELAVFFKPAQNTDSTVVFGMGATDMPSFSMSIDDQNVVDLLIKYVHKEIMPTPSLKNLEKNNFVSDKDIKFKKQFRATWTAIIVSILLGLYGMINNHLNSIGQENQFQKQIEEYQKSTDQISKNLDNLNKLKVDYSESIENISKEISNLSEKIQLALKHQTLESSHFTKDKK